LSGLGGGVYNPARDPVRGHKEVALLAPLHALRIRLADAWERFRAKEPLRPHPPIALDYYVRSAPCPQNALDLFPDEWSSALPSEYAALRAGPTRLFEDVRIDWAAQQLGGFAGQHVLELGPLEGGHTYMIEQMGAASVTAVEANARAFLKCLVTKEILGLQRSRFLLGDLMEYLRADVPHFDAIVASGVLYHLRHPAELLARLAERTDRLFLWTHYYDAELIAKVGIIADRFVGSEPAHYAGFRHTLHRYEYRHGVQWNGFCGGPAEDSSWMSRADILAGLEHFGFDEVRLAFEEPEWPHGPCFALAALRNRK
jgi:SAM-dependent methyltransferase